MTHRRVTSKDVATYAGVSRTTVSFVLNGVRAANVSEVTRERVLAAVDELGYVPDAAAQALASGRAQTIGLLFARDDPHVTAGPTHLCIIEGLMEIARQFGVRLLVDSVTQADSSAAYLRLTRTKRIDGLILFDLRVNDRALHELVHDGFPIVLLGRLPNVQVCSVEFDNRAGARAAVEHLLAQGHSRIGVIAHGPISFTGVAERVQGYRDALAAEGIVVDETLVRYGDFGPDSGFDAAMSLLAAPVVPTALFVTSDVVAFGALAAIHTCGLAIPENIAVVGFDDTPLARFAQPPLSTVQISFHEMGREAGKMLLDLIRGEVEPGCELLLGTKLIVRASSVNESRAVYLPPPFTS